MVARCRGGAPGGTGAGLPRWLHTPASVPGMPEAYFSVDVEAAGPAPCAYSLLALGACLVEDAGRTFYVELRPTTDAVDPAALAVHGLSLEHLAAHGLPPAEGLARFAAWVREVTPAGRRPVFVAFNAPFDWMFVADYFCRFEVPNPFGHSALDIKALYMGATGEPWESTGFVAAAARFGLSPRLPHHALEDAVVQAELFRRLVAGAVSRPRRPSPKETSP